MDSPSTRLAFTRYGITNIIWCMTYKERVGGGGRILPNIRAIVLHQGVQCRWAQGMKGWLIRAQKPESKTISCRGQARGTHGGRGASSSSSSIRTAGLSSLHVEYAERIRKYDLLFIFCLLCEYTYLEYIRVLAYIEFTRRNTLFIFVWLRHRNA